MDERFAGWKASPCRWKDAGEAEWWRHGRCGQVARKDAAGRSPVHPFALSRPLATGCPPRHRSIHTTRIATYTRTYTRIADLFSSSSPDLTSPAVLSSPPLSRWCPPPSPPHHPSSFLSSDVYALDPNASAALTKLPVFVLRGIAGYRTRRVNTIIDPLHFAPRTNVNLFL